jgi:septal ring factor EnvC (AmiA/AmiB activator)
VEDEAAAEAKAKYEEVSTKIAEKKDELAAVQQQISEMSPQDLLTEDGKALKEKADGLMAEIGELEGELKALME